MIFRCDMDSHKDILDHSGLWFVKCNENHELFAIHSMNQRQELICEKVLT